MSLPGGVGLPVILLTAHAMKGDRERLLFSSGANDYVAKPIADQHELVSLVRRHIETVQDFEDECRRLTVRRSTSWSGDGWIDVSRPLSPETPVWPGDRAFELEPADDRTISW